MAVCVYTRKYMGVAARTILRTAASGLLRGFDSPVTRRVFNQGKRTLDDFESFGKIIMTERNLSLKAAINYLGRQIDGSYPFDSQSYRI